VLPLAFALPLAFEPELALLAEADGSVAVEPLADVLPLAAFPLPEVPEALLLGWSDCGMLLALLPVLLPVELLLPVVFPLAPIAELEELSLEYEPFARTFSPTWSAKLPLIMLEAVTVTSRFFLSRMTKLPEPALSRHPVTVSLPERPLLARSL